MEPGVEPPPADATTPTEKPLDLLLIEDNPGDARLVEARLEVGGLDAEIRWERLLETGLEAARERRPDLLVLDLGLPDSEGLEAVRRVTDELPDVPVVVLTGRDDPELGQSAVREGAQDFLVKGEVTPGALTHTLRYALLRSRTDAEIRRREKRFGALLANVSDVISVIAPDGTVLYQSPSLKRVFGYEPEELEGEDILEYFHPEDRERVRSEIVGLADRPTAEAIDNARFRHADGSWRVLEARGRMPPPESDVEGIIVVSRDVTDRVRRQRELERTTASLTERVKEQSCLYDVTRLLHADERELERRLRDVVDRLPEGWQYPEVTAARISLEEVSWTVNDFSDSEPSLSSPISVDGEQVGSVEVCYLEDRPEEDIGPFISEERELLDAVAEQIGIAVDRRATRRELERAERHYRTLFDQSPVGVAVVSGEGRVVECNRTLAGMLGYEPAELEGIHFAEFTHPDDVEEDVELYEQLVAGEITDYQLQKRFITREGEVVWGDLQVTLVQFPEEQAQRQVAFVRDVTVEKRAREALRESEERFRQMAENIDEIFWLWDPETERVLYLSPAFEDITGRPVGFVYEEPMRWMDLIHPEDRDQVERTVFADRDRSFDVEYRLFRPDGEVRWIRARGFPVTDEGGEVYRTAGVGRDVTEQKRLEEQLRHRALHDPLTGLANRVLLVDRVQQGLARARREGHPLGLLMLDVVRFKRINDRLGHAAGDRILEALARRLQEKVREEDTVARWGGDEFVVVLPDLEGPEGIQRVHDRIRHALHRPFEATGESIHVDLAVGGVLFGEGDHPRMVRTDDPEELIRFGDLALHRAKRQGAAGFHLFDPDEEVEGVGQIRRERELRRGLEAGEFVPHYQPIVRLSDGELVGFEALARWAHPEEGILSPGEFILLAEELGLIGTLGEQVLEQGARQFARWPRGSGAVPPTVSFNLSGHQFEDPRLAATLARAVEEAGLSPERVILEVTETVIMQDPARIDELRDLGFRVYVDDFGTGYSTFSYLRDLNLDGLKIDMSFVQRIAESLTDAALVETMVKLGETLDLHVVAEGVETEEQRARLREMGCALGQGYLFDRPMPAAEVEALLD